MHRIIKKTPYEATLGPIKCGLKSTSLPDVVLNSLETEEDLEEALNEYNLVQQIDLDDQARDSEAEVLTVSCTGCKMIFLPQEDQNPKCSLCQRQESLAITQKDCFKKQKTAAEKMINVTETDFPKLQIGDNVTLHVPTVDRGPLDFPNITAVVMNIQNEVYQLGTAHGSIKGWFPRTDLIKCPSTFIAVDNVPAVQMTLRESAAKQSLIGGQGYKKCNCKASKIQCDTNRCNCKKAGILCNSRCHGSGNCKNK